MRYYINGTLLRTVKAKKKLKDIAYDVELESAGEVVSSDIKGEVLIKEATKKEVLGLVQNLEEGKYENVKGFTVKLQDKEDVEDAIIDNYEIVKAGGGLVVKEGKFLMIFRNGKWDLPKGKMEKGESMIETSGREVEEECGIKVSVISKICNTWHTYNRKGKSYLKKTSWYLMHQLDDAKPLPQEEEGIEHVGWYEYKEVDQHLKNAYSSIHEVFRKHSMKYDI